MNSWKGSLQVNTVPVWLNYAANASLLVAVITLFVVVWFENSVSTNCQFFGAFRRFSWTCDAMLYHAIGSAPIPLSFVAIITWFAYFPNSIPTVWVFSETGWCNKSSATEPCVYFAPEWATNLIFVVALLTWLQYAITTEPTDRSGTQKWGALVPSTLQPKLQPSWFLLSHCSPWSTIPSPQMASFSQIEVPPILPMQLNPFAIKQRSQPVLLLLSHCSP